jgi:ribosomal protein L37AE/L43A
MSRSTISIFQLFKLFPDVETARKYLESKLWPNGATCPKCRKTEGIITRTRVGFYRCPDCSYVRCVQLVQLDTTAPVGTSYRSRVVATQHTQPN